jgi:hypothetical protein
MQTTTKKSNSYFAIYINPRNDSSSRSNPLTVRKNRANSRKRRRIEDSDDEVELVNHFFQTKLVTEASLHLREKHNAFSAYADEKPT